MKVRESSPVTVLNRGKSEDLIPEVNERLLSQGVTVHRPPEGVKERYMKGNTPSSVVPSTEESHSLVLFLFLIGSTVGVRKTLVFPIRVFTIR